MSKTTGDSKENIIGSQIARWSCYQIWGQCGFLLSGLSLILSLVLSGSCFAQEPLDAKRQLPIVDELWIERLTWVEVRDLVQSGHKTVLIGAGGVEQNGPYVALGKHNFILELTLPKIAQKLGNALIAPVVRFVPEGSMVPPLSGHMPYAGTLSVREETFEAVIEDLCRSLRAHGFEEIVLVGDSGGNQRGLFHVGVKLDREWRAEKTRVHYIPEYYDYETVDRELKSRGFMESLATTHDSLPFSLQVLAHDPKLIRYSEREAHGGVELNGILLSPLEKFQALGNEIVEQRATRTTAAILRARNRERPTLLQSLLN